MTTLYTGVMPPDTWIRLTSAVGEAFPKATITPYDDGFAIDLGDE